MSIPKSVEGLPTGLRHVEARDTRTDAEILESLATFRPVQSERNIWALWHSGVSSMPAWNKRNIIGWIRLNGSEWTLRVMDKVPGSPNNVLQYVSSDQLPAAWTEGTMDGPFVNQHSADFARTAVLSRYGGVWVDVGIMMLRRLDDVCWRQLKDPRSPFEVCAVSTSGTAVMNGFIAARKASPMIEHWHALFLKLWEGRTNCDGLSAHPLNVPVNEDMLKPSAISQNVLKFDWGVGMPKIWDYIAQVTAWRRVCMTEDAGDGFNGVGYWSNKVLLLGVLDEFWAAESTCSYDGSKLLKYLSTRTDISPESEDYRIAAKLVWRLLTGSSMQSFYHGKTLLKGDSLASLWDKPENAGADCRPGTFAELLRYGSVHYEQDRKIEYVKAEKPTTTLKKGLFEV